MEITADLDGPAPDIARGIDAGAGKQVNIVAQYTDIAAFFTRGIARGIERARNIHRAVAALETFFRRNIALYRVAAFAVDRDAARLAVHAPGLDQAVHVDEAVHHVARGGGGERHRAAIGGNGSAVGHELRRDGGACLEVDEPVAVEIHRVGVARS